MKKSFLFTTLLCTIFVTGCATMSDVTKNKSDGISKVYEVSKEEGLNISKQVFRDEGGEAIEERPEENAVYTSSGMGLFTFGTLMAAWVEPVDTTHSNVTCVTKRKIATNIITTLTESTFHEKFAKKLKELKDKQKTTLTSSSK
ncbi:MAG: hypothetical protein HQK53_08965 [Oligoflexia bacterium]|nr:hypothetical protein [Oligoflexia bacterium]